MYIISVRGLPPGSGLMRFPQKLASQREHPLDIVHVVIDVHRKAQHAAADGELHAVCDEVLVQTVVALVARSVMIGAHRADRDDLRQVRTGLASGDRETEVEKTSRERVCEPA